MRLSIMQPYVFPYIGYFNLIEASKMIVFYDDVNFIKRGWINRNRILLNNSDHLFTFPLKKASQNKMINEIEPFISKKFVADFVELIEIAYKKAPHYNAVRDLIRFVLNQEYENISDLAINSILTIYKYLDKNISWTKSSLCSPLTKGMNKADRLVQITKDLGYNEYINLIGGQKLYDKDYFKNQEVMLYFVQSKILNYRQYNERFISGLSIIDVLMFNDKQEIYKQFSSYEIL